MKPWTLGALLACGLAIVVPACGNDASHRAQQDGDAGDAGSNAAGQGSSLPSEGGGSAVDEGGGGGTRPAEPGGDAGAAVGGNQSAAGDANAGGAACGDHFDDLLGPRPLCASVRTCYPELQQSETQCIAPGDGAPIESYDFADLSHYPNLVAIRACLCALPDQQPARAWVDCTLAVEPAAGTCFGACPEFGDDCVAPIDANAVACNEQFNAGFMDVATCIAAQ